MKLLRLENMYNRFSTARTTSVANQKIMNER